MSSRPWTICAAPDDLQEGLFGQVFLWTLELLPFLAANSIYPNWDIRSRLYGEAPYMRVIPGALDLSYEVSAQPNPRRVSLRALRARHASALGNNWQQVNAMWSAYFKVPERVIAQADRLLLPPNTLGLHYRGHDKNLVRGDTNPVSHADFLTLTEDFLNSHPEISHIFIATDEYAFVELARTRLSGFQIFNLGAVGFHKQALSSMEKADRALLDCLMLSRCEWMLKCSSALSAFAQVLNPALKAYRVSASKLFADVPYFPEAYIARLSSQDSRCRAILDRQFQGDWLDTPEAHAKFGETFTARPRFSSLKGVVNLCELALSGLRDKPKNI
jgi:hypothetical protein